MNVSQDTTIRVRYGETDQMGIVHHGNYPLYLELGRTEWLKAMGISYKEMEQNGLILPVVSLTINYKGSAYYDDLLTIRTLLFRQPTASITFEYEIYNERNELITSASTKLAFVDAKSNRPTRAPKYVLDAINLKL